MGTFADHQRISTYWFNTSEQLRDAAACVWQAFHASQKTTIGDNSFRAPNRTIYFMLCGMSLESMLKAIIVEKNEVPPTTHNLVTLASKAGVTYDAHEQDLLRILSAAVVWAGRYPVPLTQEQWDSLSQLRGSKLFDIKALGKGSKLAISVPNNELSWECFIDLWRRASHALLLIAHWVTRVEVPDAPKQT